MAAHQIQRLQDWGCDTKSALERLDGDSDFYLECSQIFCQDENFAQLDAALQRGDVRQAFDFAHTIKGVAANFGFLPLLDAIGEVVEPLRRGDLAGAQAGYKAFEIKKAQYDAIVMGGE